MQEIRFKMRSVCWTAALLSLSLLTALVGVPTAAAQSTTGTIVGSVADPTGALIPRATVTATNLDTGLSKTVSSNDAGEYRLDLLPVGRYSLTVSVPSFKKFLQSNIALTVDQEARVEVSLDPGSNAETVTVTDLPPALNLENATIGRTIDTKEVNSLPIVDRNIYSLLPLVPGVQSQVNGNTLGFPQEVVQVNGGTTSNGDGTVSYYLDGGLNMTALRNTGNIMPNPEAIQEFSVQTSNYSATYGRLSSAVVNVLTQSGANQFHGSLYEFNRNTDFDATPFEGNGKQPLHRNMFGGVVGGPIVKDRVFFFGEYSGLRQVVSKQLNSAVLPTPLEAVGNFSQFLPTSSGAITSCAQTLSSTDKSAGNFIVCDPITRKPYRGNIITDPLDVTAQAVLKSLPAANKSLGTLTPGYNGYISLPTHWNEYMGKIDYQLNAKHRIEGMYFYNSGSTIIQAGPGNLPWAYQDQEWTQQNVNVSDTFTISPTKINQTWFTYTRLFGGRDNTPVESLSSFGSNLGVQGPPSLSQITVTGYFTLSNAIGGPTAGTNFYSARDLFILNAGRHSVSVGGEFSLNKDILVTDLNNYGVFGFTGSTTVRTGNALADFMLGLQASQTQSAPIPAADNSWFYSLFVQDDWRIRPNLTINAGLRWDIQTPPTDPQNKEATFIEGRQSTVNPAMPLGVLVVGDKGIPRGIVDIPYNHLSPRLGFAWDPYGNGKTSVRASAGLFWDSIAGNEWQNDDYPFSLTYTFPVVGTLTNPYLRSPSPFPYVYTPGAVQPIVTGGPVQGPVTTFTWPYTYQLTASVQQQLTPALVLSVAYVGSLARNVSFTRDINYPVFNAANPTANTTNNVLQRRPIDTGVLGQIMQLQSNQTGNYNALQVTFSQRVTNGVSFNGFYAFSKTIDSNVLDASSAPEDYSMPKLEKGPSNFDQRSTFVTSVIWQPDYFHGENRFVSAIIKGWQLSAIVKLATGTPFSINTGKDNNNDGNTTDRGNQIGPFYNPAVNRNSRSQLIKEFFNPASFCSYSVAAPTACPGTGPAGSDGTSQRNGYYGPAQRDVDMGLFRNFNIYERLNLQFRAEASNAFNMVSLNNPNNSLSSSTVGTITSGATMREIQLGLRLMF